MPPALRRYADADYDRADNSPLYAVSALSDPAAEASRRDRYRPGA